MAQSIVLKRSALSGKVPDTSSLSLGEIAINTYDGRVFFKKSGSLESVEHIVTTNAITTGSITLTKTGSFGEIIVTQDGNFQRDIFVTRDIVANGDIDILGSLTASLSNGYVWVGNGSNKTSLVATSSFGGSALADVNLLISKTGSYATTGSNVFIGNQTISGSLILTSSLTLNDTSNQILVRNTGSGIIEYASINSLLNTKNLVTVGLSGSDGAQFNSIKAAVDSITDASEYNTYTVRVGPGVFYETAIAMKSWITVKGDSTTTTIVSASNASASVFIGADQSMLIDMQIQGTTAPSQSAVVYSSPTTPQTNAIFYVENVRFGTNYTHAKVIGTSGGNCIMQCSNVKYGGYPFTLGFHVTNDGTGIGRMQLRNVTSTNGGVTTTTGLIFAKADKPGCTFIVNGCLLTKAVGTAAGTGFWVENGGSLRLTGVNFQRWDNAIYAPNVGSAPSIDAIALNFENCNKDVLIEHTGATGKIQGTDNFLKTIIPNEAPIYEVNTDQRKLIVAKKGGDFTSISASVAWITDSSETNRYVIEVGPGQYTENTIDLTGKPYVSIVGSNIQTTEIFPATANQHIIKMGVNNEISFLTLANAGSGYAAIYVDDVGDFAQAHKVSIYDCDTGIKVLSRNNDTQFYGEYIDINGTFTYGTYVSGSNNSLCTVNVENYYLFPSGCAAIGNYVTNPSASLSLHSSTFQGDSTPNAVAVQIEDGALVEVSGIDVQDWDYAIRVPNVGAGPKFRFVGTMIHGSSTYDMDILNTQTQGRFQGISDHSMINNLSENVYWNFLDDTDGENDVTRKLSVTFADGTHTDATTLIFKGSSMGVLEGGEITISGSLTIKTQAGYGYLHDPINPEVFKRFDWIDTNLTLSPNTNNYIYINSSGTLTSSVTTPNFAQNIILGRVVTNSNGVEFIDQSPWNAEHTANRLSKFNREALGPVFAEGSIITENVTPFKLDVTQGNYYFSENNFLPVGTSSINLRQYYISGSGWNVTTSSIVPNNVYASGSQLIAMSASYYTKHSVYLVGDGVDEKYFLVINNNQYSSLVEAEGASLPNIPTYFNDGVVALASVYVQSGSSNITQIQDIRPVIGFRAAGVNASAVHGNLLGLNQDDHTQYLLVNGNRSMAGNLNLGNNDITNVDSITATTINGSINATNGVVSGSSQITISSTTGYSTFSSSLDNRLDSLESFTASLDANYVNQSELSTATGSLINSIATKLNTSSFNSYTSSNDTTNTTQNSRLSSLEGFTASLDVTYVNQTELATATGSLINSIATKLNTSSFNSYTSSNDSRVSSLESFTASLDVTYVNQTELATATGSLINSITTKLNTSSFETYTGSVDTKFTTLANVTASLINATSSYETKGSGIYSSSAQLIPTFVQNSLTSSMTVAAANTVAVASSVTTTDSTLYPTFTNNIVNATVQLKSHPSGTFYYDGVTRKVYAESFVGVIEATNGVVSGSSQIVGILTSLNSYTASNDTTNTTQNSRLTSLESFTSSLDVTYVNQTELATATGSLINSIATKINTSSFEVYTGSIDTKFTTLSNLTSSLNASTASQQNSIDLLGLFSSSENSKNSTLATYTSSIDSKFTTLSTYTSSVDTKFTTLSNLTSSLNTFTSSANSRLSSLESFTSSLDVTYVNQTELANATGSLISSIATKLNTSSFETYTGSIDTKFTTLSNVTSSLNTSTASQQNSIDLIGQFTSSENSKNSTLATYTGSVDTKFTTLANVTASLFQFTSSANTRFSNLESFTASLDATYVNQTELANVTGSLINSIATKLNTSSFETYTGSVETKFTTLSNITSSLNQSTASQQNSIDLLGAFTSSENTKNSTLATYTGSVDTKFTTLQNVTASLQLTTASLQNSVSVINSFTSSTNSRLSSIESFTASLDATYVNQTELATATGSLINSIATKLNTSSFETYTGSIDTKFTTLQNLTSSILSFTSSTNSRLSSIESFTASLDNTFVNNTELANATGSLINSIATKLDTSSFQTYTGSIDTKFTTLANLTSSLNASTASQQNSIDLLNAFSSSENTKNTTLATYTGSVDTKFTTLANVTSSLNTFTSSANSRFSNLESFTASIDNTYVNQTELANATGSLINSIATKLDTSSFQTYTGSIDSKFTTLGTYTGSVDSKFTTLANLTASLNLSTASQQNSIDLLGAFSASENTKNTTLGTYTGSIDSKFTTLQTTTASIQNSITLINTFTSSVDTKFTTLANITSSLISKTGSYATTGSNSFLGNQTITGSLVLSGSTNIAVSTATISSPFSNGNYPLSLFDGAYNFNFGFYASGVGSNRLSIYRNASQTYFDNSSGNFYFNSALIASSLSGIVYATNGVVSGSSQIVSILQSLNSYTASVDTKFTTLANVTSSLISKTGSYATTGSNTFYGAQTMSGSVYVTGDLVVIGSSSISNISASSLSIGDNQIVLNTFTPAIRYGGISVIDSGSNGTTGSLWWDSVNNHWLYEHPGDSPATYNSAILIAGPTNTGSLGQEVGLTSNRLTVATGTDHISSSQIYVDNTTVAIPANLQVTGSFDLRNAEFNATASNSSAGNVLVSTNPTSSYNSAFYNYSITSGTNARAGQIMSIWNGNTLRYTEVTTTDIGNTSTAVFSASLSGGNILLHLSSSGVWNVRSIVNLL